MILARPACSSAEGAVCENDDARPHTPLPARPRPLARRPCRGYCSQRGSLQLRKKYRRRSAGRPQRSRRSEAGAVAVQGGLWGIRPQRKSRGRARAVQERRRPGSQPVEDLRRLCRQLRQALPKRRGHLRAHSLDSSSAEPTPRVKSRRSRVPRARQSAQRAAAPRSRHGESQLRQPPHLVSKLLEEGRQRLLGELRLETLDQGASDLGSPLPELQLRAAPAAECEESRGQRGIRRESEGQVSYSAALIVPTPTEITASMPSGEESASLSAPEARVRHAQVLHCDARCVCGEPLAEAASCEPLLVLQSQARRACSAFSGGVTLRAFSRSPLRERIFCLVVAPRTSVDSSLCLLRAPSRLSTWPNRKRGVGKGLSSATIACSGVSAGRRRAQETPSYAGAHFPCTQPQPHRRGCGPEVTGHSSAHLVVSHLPLEAFVGGRELPLLQQQKRRERQSEACSVALCLL